MRDELKQKLLTKTKDGIKPVLQDKHPYIDHTEEKPLIVRLCLSCDKVAEAHTDMQRCPHCQKSFLPINYMSNVEPKNAKEFAKLFRNGGDLRDEDLIRGLFVIW